MTVENSVSKTPKLLMGSKTYDFNFDVLLEDPTAEEAKRAIKCSISDGIEETELIYGTDYTVQLNADKKGGVVTVTDPKTADWVIVIYRSYQITQGVDLNDYNEFPAETIERAFDKQTMLIQELKEIAQRSVKVTPTEDQTPEELLEEVYSKLDSATEVATNAINAADEANLAADNATKAVQQAEQQVQEVTAYIDNKKIEIDGIVTDAENSVDSAITQAVEDVKQAAVNEAESVIQDAGQTATNIAVDYVNTTVKPELQTISDNAQQYATNSRESADASKESAQTSQTYADNSKIWAEGADNSVSALGGTHSSKRWNELCSNLMASTQLSEQNAKRYAESINPDNLLNTQMITNCLTYIPQDINIELVDGTLTLKAGSKVYVPNDFEADGTTPKFDVVMIESDMSLSTGWGNSEQTFIYLKPDGTISQNPVSRGISGNSTPTTTYASMWYDLLTNKIKMITGNTIGTVGFSLPLAIVTPKGDNSTSVSSIDQVFNGIGYIGSTIFALPGIRGLVPNGKNADGSLRNEEWITDKVITRTFTNTGSAQIIALNSNEPIEGYLFGILPMSTFYYNSEENRNYNLSDNTEWQFTPIALNATLTSGVISNFNHKTTFQAVDRNDSSWLSGLGMPSSRHTNLTLGASGSNYTAPANGYFALSKYAGGTNKLIRLINGSALLSNNSVAFHESSPMNSFIPCKKGDIITVQYDATGSTTGFRFIYAEGETE